MIIIIYSSHSLRHVSAGNRDYHRVELQLSNMGELRCRPLL